MAAATESTPAPAPASQQNPNQVNVILVVETSTGLQPEIFRALFSSYWLKIINRLKEQFGAPNDPVSQTLWNVAVIMYAGAEARPTPILLRRPFASFSDAMQALGFDGTSNFTPHWSAQGLGHPKTGMATLEALVAALEMCDLFADAGSMAAVPSLFPATNNSRPPPTSYILLMGASPPDNASVPQWNTNSLYDELNWDTLAQEFKKRDIRTNICAPGALDSKLLDWYKSMVPTLTAPWFPVSHGHSVLLDPSLTVVKAAAPLPTPTLPKPADLKRPSDDHAPTESKRPRMSISITQPTVNFQTGNAPAAPSVPPPVAAPAAIPAAPAPVPAPAPAPALPAPAPAAPAPAPVPVAAPSVPAAPTAPSQSLNANQFIASIQRSHVPSAEEWSAMPPADRTTKTLSIRSEQQQLKAYIAQVANVFTKAKASPNPVGLDRMNSMIQFLGTMMTARAHKLRLIGLDNDGNPTPAAAPAATAPVQPPVPAPPQAVVSMPIPPPPATALNPPPPVIAPPPPAPVPAAPAPSLPPGISNMPPAVQGLVRAIQDKTINPAALQQLQQMALTPQGMHQLELFKNMHPTIRDQIDKMLREQQNRQTVGGPGPQAPQPTPPQLQPPQPPQPPQVMTPQLQHVGQDATPSWRGLLMIPIAPTTTLPVPVSFLKAPRGQCGVQHWPEHITARMSYRTTTEKAIQDYTNKEAPGVCFLGTPPEHASKQPVTNRFAGLIQTLASKQTYITAHIPVVGMTHGINMMFWAMPTQGLGLFGCVFVDRIMPEIESQPLSGAAPSAMPPGMTKPPPPSTSHPVGAGPQAGSHIATPTGLGTPIQQHPSLSPAHMHPSPAAPTPNSHMTPAPTPVQHPVNPHAPGMGHHIPGPPAGGAPTITNQHIQVFLNQCLQDWSRTNPTLHQSLSAMTGVKKQMVLFVHAFRELQNRLKNGSLPLTPQMTELQRMLMNLITALAGQMGVNVSQVMTTFAGGGAVGAAGGVAGGGPPPPALAAPMHPQGLGGPMQMSAQQLQQLNALGQGQPGHQLLQNFGGQPPQHQQPQPAPNYMQQNMFGAGMSWNPGQPPH